MFFIGNFLSIDMSGYAIILFILNHKKLPKKVQHIMELRPLGIAKEIIQETGLDITYNYDDLVFIEHNPFMIQFDDGNSKNLKLFFNVDCEPEAAEKLEAQLKNAALQREFTITTSGKFEMKQKEGTEEIDIKFID
ncbi:hypothetical protein [uncultured Desulfobacter sp.]|uniref:hypothetical protein n=1 Tax=uncultured Desulfobacter sp. TaxID=240139 RepID=UPI0029C94711|nr:hypothetical protein [uncultured Desulfobacter sp.]